MKRIMPFIFCSLVFAVVPGLEAATETAFQNASVSLYEGPAAFLKPAYKPVVLTRTGSLTDPSSAVVRVKPQTPAGITLRSSYDASTPGSTSLTVSFAPEQSVSSPIYVHSLDNVVSSGHAEWTLEIVNPSGSDVGTPGTQTVSVWDAAAQYQVEIKSAVQQAREGDAVQFTVGRAGPTDLPARIEFTYTSGTASVTDDLEPGQRPGFALFAAGQSETTVTIPLAIDVLNESDEVFQVNLGGPAGGVDAPYFPKFLNFWEVWTFTIKNTPAVEAREVTVADASVSEGNSGSSQLNFAVSIPSPSPSSLSFAWRTIAGGRATAEDDYHSVSGTVVIPAGQTEAVISIPVNGDTLHEADETVFLQLDNAPGVTQARSTAAGTILNDDAAPVLTIENTAVTEAAGRTFHAWFRLSLSAPSGDLVSFAYTTRPGTALAGADYETTEGTLALQPGEEEKWLRVRVLGDDLVEPAETFDLLLNNLTGATATRLSATATIRDTAITEFFKSADLWIVRFPTGIGQHYLVEDFDTEGNIGWRPNTSVLIGSGSTVTQVVYSGSKTALFRVRVTAVPPGTPSN